MKHQRHMQYLIFAILILTAHTTTAQALKTITLEQAIAIAQENNRQILTSILDSRNAEQRIREAKADAFPDIRWKAGYTRYLRLPAFFISFDGEVTKLEIGAKNTIYNALVLDQMLYNGGKVGTAVKLSEEFVDLTETELSHTRRVIAHEVRRQFYTVLMAREALRIARENLDQGRRYQRNVQQRHAQGLVSEFEQLRAEVQAVNYEPDVISAENSLELTAAGLKNLLVLDTAAPVDFTGELAYAPLSPAVRDTLTPNAPARRTDYRQLEIQQAMRLLNIKLEEGNRLPILRLIGKWQHDGSSRDFSFGKQDRVWSSDVMLSLEVPIFDGLRSKSRIQQARIETEKLDQTMAQKRDDIQLEIRQADLRMHEAEERIAVQQRNIDQARRAFDISQVRFNNGLGTQLEVFDSQLDLVVNELGYYRAIYDYLIARADWEFAVGL